MLHCRIWLYWVKGGGFAAACAPGVRRWGAGPGARGSSPIRGHVGDRGMCGWLGEGSVRPARGLVLGSRAQRRGRYLPASTAHPAKMLPAIAAHAIAAYTDPGDLVIDPLCGIGTTLVEAVHAARHGLGIEYEARWARLAAADLDHARTQGATGHGHVITGDARDLPALHERLPATLLAGLRGADLVPRASFFQLTAVRNARNARDTGTPLHVIAHEDVLVFVRQPGGSAPVHEFVPWAPSTGHGTQAATGVPLLVAA